MTATPRVRYCDEYSVHGPHDWFELNLMWECPGVLDRELAWDDPSPISAPDDLNTETVEWRDADALGDPDHEYDLALDHEMGI